MIGSDEEGDFSLRISPVTLEDDSVYQCQVASNRGPKLRSSIARLTVFVPPKHPTITPSPDVFATSGVNVTIQCQSIGGRPAPEVNFMVTCLFLFICLVDDFKWASHPTGEIRHPTVVYR